MSYRLQIKPSAEKELQAIAQTVRQRIQRAIRKLGDDPRPPGARKLANRPEWRLRVGQYRIIYAIDDASQTIDIVKIGHRRDVYH